MTKPASDNPVRRRSTFTPYAIVWSMLGTLGLGYLGVAIFAPDLLGELTPTGTRSERYRADTDAAIVKLSADVNGVRSSMAKLQLDVASIKSDVATQRNETQSLGTQVSELQDKMRPPQTPIASTNSLIPSDQVTTTASVVEPETPDTGAGNGASATAAAGNTAPSDAAPTAAKIINAAPAAPKPIITGSVDAGAGKSKGSAASANAISFGPAIVKPAAKPIGLVIGSDASVDALRQSWTTLSEAHADKLKKLKARVAENGDFKNPSFNLIAGPVKSKTEAVRICKDLQAKQVNCKVGEFKGEEL